VGAGSIPYYAAATSMAIFALRHLLFIEKYNFTIVLVCFLPVLFSFLHVNTVDVYRESLSGTFDVILQTAAITVVLLIMLAANSFSENHFRFALFWICIFHLPFLMLGLTLGIEGIGIDSNARLASGFATAAYAEIALGTLICSFFTRRMWLIGISVCFASGIFYFTQMRGASLAAMVVPVVLFIFTRNSLIRSIRAPSIFLMIILATLFASQIAETVSNALLLDDPHRGFSSGFSGRLDSWIVGLLAFERSPIIGAGTLHPEASGTHNGLLRLAAEFGLFCLVAWVGVIFVAARKSIRQGDFLSFAVILSYLAFMMTAPRYINFQLTPLIYLLVIANVLSRKSQRIAGASRRAPMHRQPAPHSISQRRDILE